MHRFLFSLLFFSSVTTYSFSQKYSIGIAVGSSFSNIKSKNDSEPYLSDSYKPGWLAAFSYSKLIKNKFIAESTIGFTQKGYHLTRVQPVDSHGHFSDEQITLNYTLNYIDLGVKTGIRYGNTWFGQTTIGLTPSLLLSSIGTHKEVTTVDATIPAVREKSKDEKRFDLSLNLETSLGVRLTDRSSLLLTLGYNMGVYNIAKDESDKYYNRCITTRIGYNYSF